MWCQKEGSDEETRRADPEDLISSGNGVGLFPKGNVKPPKGFNLENLISNLKFTFLACREWK